MRIYAFGRTEVGTNARSDVVSEEGDRFHSKGRLEAILRREQARADRNGRPLCLVVFRIEEEDGGGTAYRRLARTVVHRARITDDVGEFEEGAVGAVLADTPAAGAWKFAHDVVESLCRQDLSAAISVYTYPSNRTGPPWMPHAGSGTHDGASRHGHTPDSHGRSVRGGEHHARHLALEAAAEPLEPLLLKPTPRWKRALDIVGASTALLLLSPILLAAAAAIKFSSPGPVFFTQMRTGRGGKAFRMCKFRTMHVGAERRRAELGAQSEQDGPAFKMRNDPRITRIGRVLRKTSIDELPQLWNVLKGEMSLVGPRPLPCEEAAACHRSWYRTRHHVLPGLTCIWQVEGRSRVSFEEWMRMDAAYIRSVAFVRDMRILMQTIPAVLLRRGAC